MEKNVGICAIGGAALALLLSTCSSQLISDGSNRFTATEAIFVSTGLHNSVAVYPLGADGDVRPSELIKGAATELDDAKSIAVDSSGKIYVLNNQGGDRDTGTVEVFAPGSRGDVSPIARIAGADTGLRSVNNIAVDSSGEIMSLSKASELGAYLPVYWSIRRVAMVT